MFVVSGSTYPVRHDLRLVGCRFVDGAWITEHEDTIERLKRLGTNVEKLKISVDKRKRKT